MIQAKRNTIGKKCLYPVFLGVFFLLSISLMLQLLSVEAHAAQATLAWNANSETDLAGYRVYYGTNSGSYSCTVDVGNWTSLTVTGLNAGQTYYFACKAYNTAGSESGYSNEVSYTTPSACSYTITPTSQSFGSSGGSGCVEVAAQTGCPWTAASGASWVAVTGGASGTGPGTVSYSVAPNTTGSSRASSMTIAGRAFSVNQSGITSTVTLSASAGNGGSISPSGSVTVGYGSSKTFTIKPRWFYRISDVQVNGISVGAVSTYTFSNLTKNQTIRATFKRKY